MRNWRSLDSVMLSSAIVYAAIVSEFGNNKITHACFNPRYGGGGGVLLLLSFAKVECFVGRNALIFFHFHHDYMLWLLSSSTFAYDGVGGGSG